MAAPGTSDLVGYSDLTPTLLSGKDGDGEGPVYQVQAEGIWVSLDRKTRPCEGSTSTHIQRHSLPGHLWSPAGWWGPQESGITVLCRPVEAIRPHPLRTGSTVPRQMSRLKPRAGEQTSPGVEGQSIEEAGTWSW